MAAKGLQPGIIFSQTRALSSSLLWAQVVVSVHCKRKLAMVVQSQVRRPLSHMSSTLRGILRPSCRLE